MKIPEKINISGIEYEVIKTEGPLVVDGDQVYGLIDYNNRKIKLDTNIQDEQGVKSTFIHEVLHGIVFDRQIDWKNDGEETIIEQLSRGLYSILKDNDLV